MLLTPSANGLEQGKNLSVEHRACIVRVLGKEDDLDFGPAEKKLPFFFFYFY